MAVPGPPRPWRARRAGSFAGSVKHPRNMFEAIMAVATNLNKIAIIGRGRGRAGPTHCSKTDGSDCDPGSRYRRPAAATPFPPLSARTARAPRNHRVRCIDLHADLSGVCTKFRAWCGRRHGRGDPVRRHPLFRARRRVGPKLQKQTPLKQSSVKQAAPKQGR